MFETDIHLALQSLDCPSLRAFMVAVSFVGNVEFLVPLVIVVMFGVDIRRGFALLHVILWTAVLTSIFKDWFAYPRPDLADARVLLLGEGRPNLSPFVGMDAADFWSPLPGQVVELHRLMGLSHGIPSAHASIALATWGGLSLLFRHRLIRVLSALLIVLTPLSRMYLGKHFLADVLAGLVLGAVTLALAAFLLKRRGDRAESPLGLNTRTRILVAAYLLGTPPLLALVPEFSRSQAALLWGLNAGFLVSWFRGFRPSPPSFAARVIAVGAAGSALTAGYVGSLLGQNVLAHALIAIGGFVALMLASQIGRQSALSNNPSSEDPPKSP